MDALKADAELADIPVIMISIVDDRLVAEKLKEFRAGRDIRVMVMSHGLDDKGFEGTWRLRHCQT